MDAVRAVLEDHGLDPTRIGILAFGQGGQLALAALADGGGLFRGAVIRSGWFRSDRYLDGLKRTNATRHAEMIRELDALPEAAFGFALFPATKPLVT